MCIRDSPTLPLRGRRRKRCPILLNVYGVRSSVCACFCPVNTHYRRCDRRRRASCCTVVSLSSWIIDKRPDWQHRALTTVFFDLDAVDRIVSCTSNGCCYYIRVAAAVIGVEWRNPKLQISPRSDRSAPTQNNSAGPHSRSILHDTLLFTPPPVISFFIIFGGKKSRPWPRTGM